MKVTQSIHCNAWFAMIAALGLIHAHAAPLTGGSKIGIDFGPTAPTNHFNQVAATSTYGSISAGSVIDTSNTVVDGVGFNYSGSLTPFSNNDANEGQAGQPSVFESSNLTDWLGMSGAPDTGVMTLTFTGLDDALTYDLTLGAAFTNNLPDTFWQVDGQSATTDADVVGSSYVSFTGLSTDGSGNLVITGTGTDPRPDIPTIAALQLTAIGGGGGGGGGSAVVNDGATTDHLTFIDVAVISNDNLTGTVTLVEVVDNPASGTAVVQGDNSIRYTHTTGTPSSDSFTYRYTDDNGQSELGTVTITLTTPAGPDPSVAYAVTLLDLGEWRSPLVDKPNDPDGDDVIGTLGYHLFGAAGENAAPINSTNGPLASLPSSIAATRDSGSEVSFVYASIDNPVDETPPSIISGTTTGSGGGAQRIATIQFGAGVPPTLAMTLMHDNLDSPGFNATGYEIRASDGTTVLASTSGSNNNQVPDWHYFDLTGVTAGGQVQVWGTGGSHPTLSGITFDEGFTLLPAVVDDSATMPRLTSADVEVLANDNPVGSVTLVEVVDSPASGTAVVQPDNSIRYTHTSGTPTTDSFTYRITDDNGPSSLGTVSIIFTAPPVVPGPSGPPSYVWQIDFQGAAGGAFGSSDPVDCEADLGDGPSWNPFEIEATNDKVFSDPPNHNAVVNPQLLDLMDATGNSAGVNLRFVDDPDNPGTATAASPYNTGGISALGGADAAYGDHWFFGAQGTTTLDLFFQFENLPQGSYELTAYANPSPHNPPRDFSVTVGATTVPINPTFASNPGYADAGSFEGTISNITVGSDGLLEGVFGTIAGDPSLAAAILRLVVGDDFGAMNYGEKFRIPVLANDNPTGTVTFLEVVSGPAWGTAVVQPEGTILYTHTTGTPSSDSFTYRYTDDNGVSQIGTVHITFETGTRIDPVTLNLPASAPVGDLSIVDAFEGRGDFTFEKPTGMATIEGNDLRFFVAEKDGIIWEFPDIAAAAPIRSVFMDFTDAAWRAQAGGELDQWIEMGVKGFTFHPQFENGSPYVFVTYNFEAGSPSSAIGTARVSRFTATSNGAGPVDMLSEVVLLELDNVSSIHNIDGAEFGPDGYLYVGFGDDANPGLHAQTITNKLWSSIIRIDVDRKPGNLEPNPASFVMTDGGGQAYYKIPADNPYAASSGTIDYNGSSHAFDAVRSEIYVSGARNPWRFSFDNIGGTPVIWYGDIGSGGADSREEINIARNGDNVGWMVREGGDRTQIFVDGDGNTVTGPAGRIYSTPGPGVTLRDPEFFYARGSGPYEGASVTGGYVTRSGRYLSLEGKYIFGDWLNGHLWSLERTATEGEPIVTRIGGMASPTAFIEDPSNGDILVLSWNSEAGGLFASGGQVGRVFRIQQEAASNAGLPVDLIDTGIFADLTDLSVNPGMLAYDPLVTFWSDHARKKRWMAVPGSAGNITFSQDDPWKFPSGSVFVKHFDMELRRGDPTSAKRLETRVVVKNDDGVYGVSYRWNEAGTAATLVPDGGESFDLQIDDDNNPSTPDVTQTWTIPSRTQCNVCHNSEADHVLGINTRQLNHSSGSMFGQFGNQLDLLEQFGMLDGYAGPASGHPAHARIEDSSASLDARARTYLDVNCAYCHREDGGLNLRTDVTLAEMNVLGHPDTGHHTSTNPNLERIRMGYPADSSVLQRTKAAPDFNRMPPLGSALIDEAGVQLLTAWIQQLDPAQPLDNGDIVDLALKGPGGTFVGEDDPGITGFEEDPDADGIVNGIEVLLGLDPDAEDQVQILTHELVEDTGQHFFEVELVLSDDFADQLDWKIKWSDELGVWTDSFTTTTTVSIVDGKRTVRVRDTRPLDGTVPHRFYRLSLDGAEVP